MGRQKRLIIHFHTTKEVEFLARFFKRGFSGKPYPRIAIFVEKCKTCVQIDKKKTKLKMADEVRINNLVKLWILHLLRRGHLTASKIFVLPFFRIIYRILSRVIGLCWYSKNWIHIVNNNFYKRKIVILYVACIRVVIKFFLFQICGNIFVCIAINTFILKIARS